jgi:antirestriction protein ArdC
MSVYDEITQAIIAELEKGVPPWVKSWSSHLPMNVVSQKRYRASISFFIGRHRRESLPLLTG